MQINSGEFEEMIGPIKRRMIYGLGLNISSFIAIGHVYQITAKT